MVIPAAMVAHFYLHGLSLSTAWRADGHTQCTPFVGFQVGGLSVCWYDAGRLILPWYDSALTCSVNEALTSAFRSITLNPPSLAPPNGFLFTS